MRARPHVLIVVQNMPVPLDRRVWLECRTLRDNGYDVSVICPKGPRDPSYEEIDGVRLYKYRCAPPATGLLGYGFEFVYCFLRAAFLARRVHRYQRIDVLQACNPPDTYWLLARVFRKAGVKFVFDHHDLCPELYLSKPGRKRQWLLRALSWLEERTFASADLVLSTNESYRKVACARTGYDPNDVVVVRSGPDPEAMQRGEPRPELRNGRAHLACYLGLMNPQDGVDTVIRVADVVVRELHRTDIQFGLLGYGDCLEDLKAMASTRGLDDFITFAGRVELPQITEWLSTADVGVSPDPFTPFNDVSTMNKTLEYLAYGLPVVAFDLTETVVSAGPAASYVAPSGDPDDDARALAVALVALVDDPERRARMGAAGRARIEDSLGWPASAKRYVRAFDRLVHQ